MSNKKKVTEWDGKRAGDTMYIPTALHISRGSDDVAGGLATIDYFELSDHLTVGHFNFCMVVFKEFPSTAYNYENLKAQQNKLKAEYGDRKAYADPDIDTPWIEEGDIVNGEVYKGDPIW